MKKLIAIIFIFIATTAFAEIYTVERVIDGDTIVVTTPEGKSETVELIGVDAPPVFPEGIDLTMYEPSGEEREALQKWGVNIGTLAKIGEEATKFVNSVLSLGMGQRAMERGGIDSRVKLEFDMQEKDKHDKLLAYVYVWVCSECDPGFPESVKRIYNEADYYVFLNALIIQSGYATPMIVQPNLKYADLFRNLYEEAKKEKRGLWKENSTAVTAECKGHGEKPVWDDFNDIPKDIEKYSDLMDAQCCDGLVVKVQKEFFEPDCRELPYGGYAGICLTCGDGYCDKKVENRCNCQEDCENE